MAQSYNPYGGAYASQSQQGTQNNHHSALVASSATAGAMQLQTPQQQQPHPMLALADAWRQLDAQSDQADSSHDTTINASIAKPVRLDGTNSITITRELHWKHSPEELASMPELATQTFESSADFKEMRANGVKLVPQSIRVIEKQNGLPFAIGINFDKPGSKRKTLKINANCMTSDNHDNVDVVVREGAHAPTVCSTSLFVSNKYSTLDLTPFQGMHQVTKEELRAGVIHEDPSPHGNPALAYAEVVANSTVHQIAHHHAAEYQLDGQNVRSKGFRFDNQGNAFEILQMPLHVVNSAIDWGNRMIDELPFQDPEDLVATVVRLDGKPFDEMDNEQDTAMDAQTLRVPFGITIEEIYAPFRCTDDGSLAVFSHQ